LALWEWRKKKEGKDMRRSPEYRDIRLGCSGVLLK
jgi:hypothetical protein